MTEFVLASDVGQFLQLDEAEILEGYMDGYDGSAEPGSDRSRSYWHGWLEGRVDARLIEPDAAFLRLQNAFEEHRCSSRH